MTRSEENNKSAIRYLKSVLFLLAFLTSGSWLLSCEPQTPPDLPDPVTDSRFVKADQAVEQGVLDSLFAGAVLLIGDAEQILHQRAFGYAALYAENGSPLPDPEVMTGSHLFDLASLTKIFATTFALMHLHGLEMLDLDEPVSHYIPEFDTADKRTVTPRHLLTHSSGLIAWFPTYYIAENPQERRELTARQKLISNPGEKRRYSDLGFMILGDLVERISGETLDDYLKKNIYQPMELTSTLFFPRRAADSVHAGDDTTSYTDGEKHAHEKIGYKNIVSTSLGNPFEKRMIYDDEFGYQVDVEPGSWNGWRNYVLRGEVNDGNAFHAHKGVAGHAGLFSTAEDLYHLLLPILNEGTYKNLRLFQPETIAQFLERDSFDNGLGWAMNPQIFDAGELSEKSFGHTGFTGTHFVVLPDRNIVFILLTNRQHFGVDENGNYPNLRELREWILHEIIVAHDLSKEE